MSEIAGNIDEDLQELERQIPILQGIERFEEIQSQVENLTAAADAQEAHYTLAPMVNRLIRTLRAWNTSIPPIEANNGVAIIVRNLALHLWNEHQKLDFATQITNTLSLKCI